MGTTKRRHSKPDGGFCTRTIPVIPLDWHAEMEWETQRAKYTGKCKTLTKKEIAELLKKGEICSQD